MPYDETLAQRVRDLLGPGDRPGESIVERKMFGGLAFMLNGNMCCGVEKENLMLRVGPARYEETLSRPHARPMDFTGRPMKGFIYVDAQGVADSNSLQEWLTLAVDFAASLPPK